MNITLAPLLRVTTILLLQAILFGCDNVSDLGQSVAGQTPTPCHERYENCDRSCDVNGILGSRHVHPDCSVTCDMICGGREGYAPWRKTEPPDRP
jgi:hypothetical protein